MQDADQSSLGTRGGRVGGRPGELQHRLVDSLGSDDHQSHPCGLSQPACCTFPLSVIGCKPSHGVYDLGKAVLWSWGSLAGVTMEDCTPSSWSSGPSSQGDVHGTPHE